MSIGSATTTLDRGNGEHGTTVAYHPSQTKSDAVENRSRMKIEWKGREEAGRRFLFCSVFSRALCDNGKINFGVLILINPTKWVHFKNQIKKMNIPMWARMPEPE